MKAERQFRMEEMRKEKLAQNDAAKQKDKDQSNQKKSGKDPKSQ